MRKAKKWKLRVRVKWPEKEKGRKGGDRDKKDFESLKGFFTGGITW